MPAYIMFAYYICRTNSSDNGFFVLHKTRHKKHLAVLEAITITENPRGIRVKVLDCDIVVYEFELQSCYYFHFQTNSLGKGINLLILPETG